MQEIYIDQDYEFTKNGSTKTVNGIEYVKLMRLYNNFREPVLFISFHSKEIILDRPQTQIINAVGHKFLRLPFSPEEYKEAKEYLDTPLSDIQLSDIKYNFCYPESSLREEFHRFKGRLRSIQRSSKSHEEIIKGISLEIESFKKIIRKDYKDIPELLEEFRKLEEKFNEEDIKSVDNILAVTEDSFSVIIKKYSKTNSEDLSQEEKKEKKPWKILFLDDQLEELKDVFTRLDLHNIEYIKVTNVEDAKKEIEEDKANKISVVVSDFRLLKNPKDEEKSQQQKLQGYDFLEWLAVQNRYNAPVALSGLSTKFLFDSFRKKSINVKVYSKNAVIDGGASFFVEELEQLGEEINEVINNQPIASQWEKELKSYYIYHRNHKHYLTNEILINNDAEKVVREFERSLETEHFSFNALQNIRGGSESGLNPNKIDGNSYNIFIKKLTQRRVILFLIFKYCSPYIAYSIIKKGKIDNDLLSEDKKVRDVANNNYKQVGTNLALRAETDIPYHILVEEKNFLNNIMNVPIYDIQMLLDQTYIFLNKILNKHLESNELLKNELRNYCVEENGKLFLTSVSVLEVHILIRKIVNILKKSQEDKQILKEIVEETISVFNDIDYIIPTHYHSIDSLINKLKNKIIDNNFSESKEAWISEVLRNHEKYNFIKDSINALGKIEDSLNK